MKFLSLRQLTLFIGMLLLGLLFLSFKLHAQESYSDRAFDLTEQLYELAEENNFTIQGIEKVERSNSKPVNGDLESKIKQMLSGFNYMFIQNDKGHPEKLIILEKIIKRPNQIILSTKKYRSQHIISVSIKGISNKWLDVDLMVDTGAEYIILPSSMMSELGFISEEMDKITLQTVNGNIEAKTGRLDAIEIGNHIISDIGVAFVEDAQLGNIMLLGMNVLSRYRLTIDDKINQITLTEID